MISHEQLSTWLETLHQGDRLHLHRREQLELVQEIFRLREANRILQTQIQALNESLSIIQKRGERTGGIGNPAEPIHDIIHGSVMPWFESWGPLGVQCDWGQCSNIANHGRFDAYGFGWLPCCEECSHKPV
jgi:hypothetical protein